MLNWLLVLIGLLTSLQLFMRVRGRDHLIEKENEETEGSVVGRVSDPDPHFGSPWIWIRIHVLKFSLKFKN